MLIEYGFSNEVLQEIKYDENERPYLNDIVDFNISHSGDMVIGAISNSSRVGVDIEKIGRHDLEELKEIILSKEEIVKLDLADDPARTLYDIWTLKEAVLKANGVGLKGSMNKILILDRSVQYDGILWSFKNLDMIPDYSCHLVYNKESFIRIKHLKVPDLIGGLNGH